MFRQRQRLVIVIGTKNAHKIREILSIWKQFGSKKISIRFVPSSRFSDMPEVKESGRTYSENAAKKALLWAKHTDLPTLAEDSGIEVKALRWQPAVHSARFASSNKHKNANDSDNNRKLLDKLSGLPMTKRIARYRSSVVIASPDGKIIAKSDGICRGRIAFEPRGENGFGYDPIFIPDENNRSKLTFGQLPPMLKHSISHRGKSIRKIFERLIGNYPT